nr:MAG: putative RNA-dependent RNA polymerase [Narnaviridae sp.]
MKNFDILHTIDGVLDRLHAIRPPWAERDAGPKQWLLLHEPQDSLEPELVRRTTTLSAPTFAPSERFDPLTGIYHLEGGEETLESPPPLLDNGLPLPRPRRGQVPYSVDFRLLHCLSGARALLLTLIDSSHTCAKDSDYVGSRPAEDSLLCLDRLSAWSEEDFVPNSKYWKDYPLARFLRNPPPPQPTSWSLPGWSPLFGGETGDFMRRLTNYDSGRPDAFPFYRAVFAISQSKRGFATVPKSFVRRALVKHARQLSIPPISSPDLSKIRAFCQVLFRQLRIPKLFLSAAAREPSTRACVERSRQDGGAREYLRDLISSHQGVDPDGDTFIQMREVSPGKVLTFSGVPPLPPSGWRDLAGLWKPSDALPYLPRDTVESLGLLFQSVPSAGTFPIARVAEVLEPLKVRLITAMSALHTYLSSPLQKTLWDYLRSFPAFQLIGEPVTDMVIHDLLDRHAADGGQPSDLFVSGDYSAATDGLNIEASRVVIDVILEHLDPEDRPFAAFFRQTLLEQVLVYPAWSKIPPILQANGQLMGSVLSFAVLCVLNLYAYVDSREDSHLFVDRASLSRLPVKINGDDILFRTTPARYQAWLRAIDRVGFSLSVGKNFTHPRFFTVNSVPIECIYPPIPPRTTLFSGPYPRYVLSTPDWTDLEDRRDLQALDPPPPPLYFPTVRIGGFLNVGLLTGQAKLTGRESLASLPLLGWHAGAVLGALHPSQAHKWFLHYHLAEIRRQTRFGGTTLNIFAHPLLGGLGFQVPEGVEPRFSPEQRRLARALYLSSLYTYEGQEGGFDLGALIVVESDRTGLRLAGRKSRRVEVQLYPTGTPLPEGYEPFADLSGVYPLPLSTTTRPTPRSVLEDGPVREADIKGVRCRLSDSQIRRLTRRFGDVVELHPLEEMTSFPFIPVRVPSSSSSPLIRTYAPLIPFQDPVTGHEWDDLPDLLEPPPVVLEDWETADISLMLGSRSGASTPSLPSPLTRSTATLVEPPRSLGPLPVNYWRRLQSTEASRRTTGEREFGHVFSRKGGRKW